MCWECGFNRLGQRQSVSSHPLGRASKKHSNSIFPQEKLSYVSLWNIFRKSEVKELEISDSKKRKEIATFAKWSKTHPVLAIGTSKGKLIFFNKNNSKKIPTQGKHTKAIIDGEWNNEGFLVTSGLDKLMTVSNYNSDTIFDVSLTASLFSINQSVSVKYKAELVKWT